MANIVESIISSAYRTWDETNQRWKRYSFWNKAEDTEFDNTDTGIKSNNVQGALKEIKDIVDHIETTADYISYDNTKSGLNSTHVQGAIDEIKHDLSNMTVDLIYIGASAPAANTGYLLYVDTNDGVLYYRQNTTTSIWTKVSSVWV